MPTTNSMTRKTLGIPDATRTNVITNATPKALTEGMVIDLLQKVWENSGIQVSETATLMCNAWQMRQLTTGFVTTKNYHEQSCTLGGVAVTTIETVLDRFDIMLNRNMPTDVVQVVSLDQCAPVLLESPGKGSCSPSRWPRPAAPIARRPNSMAPARSP